MSPSTLVPPEKASTEVEARPPKTPVRLRTRPDLLFGRTLGWAFGASALFHLFLFLLSPSGTIQLDRTDLPPASVGQEAVRIILPVPFPGSEAADPAADLPDPVRAARSDPAPPEEEAAQPRPDAPAVPAARANPLVAGERDARLHVQPREPGEERGFVATPHERYMRQLQSRLDAVNDSIGAAAERERRASDWTTTDSQGRRWGISPEGFHLGPITLPAIDLERSGGHSDEARERARRRREILDQEAARDRDRARREAADETRRRRDRERDSD